MNAGMRASVVSMDAVTPQGAGFKRQVVFRVGLDDWALLQSDAAEHGSIQAAVIAGIRARGYSADDAMVPIAVPALPSASAEPDEPDGAGERPAVDAGDEITAREAAELLGLEAATI